MYLPPVLLPYQRRWIDDHGPVKIGVKSRQIGLTWANAAEDVLTAASAESAGGMDCYYLCQSQADARQYVEVDCRMWADAFGKIASLDQTSLVDPDDAHAYQVQRIRFASGFSIYAMVAHPRNLRGKKGKVTLDEAAYNDHAHEFLAAVLPMTRWRGRVAIISTESHDSTEFHRWRREVEEGHASRADWSLHVITLDDAIRDGLYKRMCLRRGEKWTQESQDEWRAREIAALGDAAGSELYCEPIGGGDVYIPRSVIAANADPSIPVYRVTGTPDLAALSLPDIHTWADSALADISAVCLSPADRHVVGVDVGRSRDLFSVAVLAVGSGGARRIAYVLELSDVPYAAQDRIVCGVIDRLPQFGSLHIDSGGAGKPLAESLAHRYGVQIHGVQIGVGKARASRPPTHVQYSELLPPLKRALQSRELPIPADPAIADDLAGLRLVDGMPRIPSARSRSGGQTRHCDSACSIALAVLSADELSPSYGSHYGSHSTASWWGGTL